MAIICPITGLGLIVLAVLLRIHCYRKRKKSGKGNSYVYPQIRMYICIYSYVHTYVYRFLCYFSHLYRYIHVGFTVLKNTYIYNYSYAHNVCTACVAKAMYLRCFVRTVGYRPTLDQHCQK